MTDPLAGHPHASEAARRIAEAGTVLLVQVGSGVHGTSISGQDDRDEMGLCLEPAEFVNMRTGRVTLPIPEPELSQLRAVRRGEWELSAVLAWLADLEADLEAAGRRNELPPEPDWAWINGWLHRSYLEFWAG